MYSTLWGCKKKVFIGEGTVNSNDVKWDGNYSEGYGKIVFSVSPSVLESKHFSAEIGNPHVIGKEF